jgi:hypothetical protein
MRPSSSGGGEEGNVLRLRRVAMSSRFQRRKSEATMRRDIRFKIQFSRLNEEHGSRGNVLGIPIFGS